MTAATTINTASQDTGPLDWRTGIVDSAGRPTPYFQRAWNTQRNNNGLIGTFTLGNGPPSASPAPNDGQQYVDETSTPPTLYTGIDGVWVAVGPRHFIELLDAPNTYVGKNNELVIVNPGATAVEFTTVSDALDIIGATQNEILVRGASSWELSSVSAALDLLGTPAEGDLLYRGVSGWQLLAPGTAGQVLSTNGAGAAPTWITGGGGGGGAGLLTIVKLSSNQSIPSASWTGVNWDTVIEDDVGAFSLGSPTIVTVPTGYTKARLNSYIIWDNAGSGNRFQRLDYKPSGGSSSTIRVVMQPQLFETGSIIQSRWFAVSAGDTFSVLVNTDTSINLAGTGDGFAVPSEWQIEWSS